MLLQPTDHQNRRSAPAPRTAAVVRALLRWYRCNGRKDLPWRLLRSPYYTLVSEFMLQQTQAARVVERFETFVDRFPDFAALAAAPVADVLRAWRGLGYNARAVRLKAVAVEVQRRYGGAMPQDAGQLLALPGVGPYTAAAIRAFAFDLDDAPMDTNVRRIVRRLQFGSADSAAPSELQAAARDLVPRGRGHDWSSALMDLGSSICTARSPRCPQCPLRRWCLGKPDGVVKTSGAAPRAQRSPFRQTTRYARGRVVDRLRDLPPGQSISLLDLHRDLGPLPHTKTIEELQRLVADLRLDGLLHSDASGNVSLPE